MNEKPVLARNIKFNVYIFHSHLMNGFKDEENLQHILSTNFF